MSVCPGSGFFTSFFLRGPAGACLLRGRHAWTCSEILQDVLRPASSCDAIMRRAASSI